MMSDGMKKIINGLLANSLLTLFTAVAIHACTFFMVSFLAWDFTFITFEGHRWTFFASWLISVFLANRDLGE